MSKGGLNTTVQPSITQFLRAEAKSVWANLPGDMKSRMSKQQIFTHMKKAWKDGNTVKREHRTIKESSKT